MTLFGEEIQTVEIYMVAGMALVTFGIRYILLPISGRFQFPKRLEQGLRFVPPVVLTAIILPSVLMPKGMMDVSLANPYLIGALSACATGWIFKNLLLTIVLSMAVFLGAQWIIAA